MKKRCEFNNDLTEISLEPLCEQLSVHKIRKRYQIRPCQVKYAYFLCGVFALFGWQSSSADTVLVGHRGGDSRQIPENTLGVVVDSFTRGVRGHELDIRKSSDGKLMLMHDNTVDRTTNGTGGFTGFSSAELLGLDVGSWKSAKFAGYKIPYLSDVLSAIKRNGSKAYLDIKGNVTPAEVQAMVDSKAFDPSQLTFLTHSNSQTTAYNNQFPAAEVFRSMWGTVYTGAAEDAKLAAFASLGVDGVTIRDIHYTPEYVQAIHAAGLKVALVGFWVWSTQRVEDYISNGVDELWLDDLRSNLGKYKNGSGALRIPTTPQFAITGNLVPSGAGYLTLTCNSVKGNTCRIESSVKLTRVGADRNWSGGFLWSHDFVYQHRWHIRGGIVSAE